MVCEKAEAVYYGSNSVVWLSSVWSEWRSSVFIVKAATVIAWHRKGFRLFWTWKIRHGKTLARSIRDVMSANPVCLPADTSIQEAARAMRDKDIGDIIVEKD